VVRTGKRDFDLEIEEVDGRGENGENDQSGVELTL
jgi:hypothetical protein